MPTFTPTGQACGAVVTAVDLSRPLPDAVVAALRAGLDEHHVLAFPGQDLTHEDLERFSTYFGDLGHDPWFVPIDGSEYIAEIRRDADETSSLFAEGWHTDWSFLETPPIATCLYGVDIPPVGGDTLFADQHLAYEHLPSPMRDIVDGLIVRHSTRHIYGAGGLYDPDSDAERGRSMQIVGGGEAFDGEHPLVRRHEGNGRRALYSTLGYIQGVVGMEPADGFAFLRDLQLLQVADEFVYRHRWEPRMCVIWDNRSVLHRATGGYDGHARRLLRTTILPPSTAR